MRGLATAAAFWRYYLGMQHDLHDRVSMAIARRVAAGLDAHPEWIATAIANLDRWSSLNRGSPGLLRCYDEWRQVLGRGVDAVRAVLLAESDEGQRLRQNFPFAGVLSPDEVWAIKRQVRDDSRAA